MLYREYCTTVQDRRGNLLPETDLKGLQGYVSVFAFCEADAAEIRAAGHSRGFRNYPVGASMLIMDFDDGFGSAEDVSARLTVRNITHWVFSSGGKGAHIYANVEAGFNRSLPSQHHALAMDLSPHCDPSLYRHNSLIRLPGTVHERTGKRKELTSKFSGTEALKLPPAPLFTEPELKVGDKDALYFMFAQLASALEAEVQPGRRHELLWRLVADCRRAGLSFDTCRELACTINSYFNPPKDEQDVLTVVQAGYV